MDKFWGTKQGNFWEARLQKDVLCMIRFFMVLIIVHFFPWQYHFHILFCRVMLISMPKGKSWYQQWFLVEDFDFACFLGLVSMELPNNLELVAECRAVRKDRKKNAGISRFLVFCEVCICQKENILRSMTRWTQLQHILLQRIFLEGSKMCMYVLFFQRNFACVFWAGAILNSYLIADLFVV